MDLRFHTKAIIYNQQWKILVQKRSDTWKWDLPWWRTEIPERIEDAIVREIKEETWIDDVVDLKLIHLESHFSSQKNQYFVLVIFKWQTEFSDSNISDEHQDYDWVTKDEIFKIWMSDYLQESLWKVRDLF
jgi:8-oxo-dGTP pyrophosphatase MutT (NUDIX family)